MDPWMAELIKNNGVSAVLIVSFFMVTNWRMNDIQNSIRIILKHLLEK